MSEETTQYFWTLGRRDKEHGEGHSLQQQCWENWGFQSMMKSRLVSHTHYENQVQRNRELDIKLETLNLLENKKSKALEDTGMGKDFLNSRTSNTTKNQHTRLCKIKVSTGNNK